MKKDKKPTPGKLILFSVLFAIMILIDSLLIIYSPYVVVRALNLVAVIVLSLAIGAFIREIFVIKNREDSQSP